jgi:hypothetical protein
MADVYREKVVAANLDLGWITPFSTLRVVVHGRRWTTIGSSTRNLEAVCASHAAELLTAVSFTQ